MATAKKKLGKRVTKIVGRSTVVATFKQPNWRQWMVRPLSIRQAAFITMGWQPMPGLIGLLKSKPLKRNEFRTREAALNEALGGDELPRAGDGKLPVVDLVTVLKFAQAKEWSMHKSTPKVLERAQAISASDSSHRSERSVAKQERRPAEGVKLVELDASTVPSAYATLGQRGKSNGDKPTTRLEKTLLRSLGALAMVLRHVCVNGGGSDLLRGSQLSVASVAERVASEVSKHAHAGGYVPGYTSRTLQMHVANALREYGKAGSDLFDLNEEVVAT